MWGRPSVGPHVSLRLCRLSTTFPRPFHSSCPVAGSKVLVGRFSRLAAAPAMVKPFGFCSGARSSQKTLRAPLRALPLFLSRFARSSVVHLLRSAFFVVVRFLLARPFRSPEPLFCRPSLRSFVRPLCRSLYSRWRFGSLRLVFGARHFCALAEGATHLVWRFCRAVASFVLRSFLSLVFFCRRQKTVYPRLAWSLGRRASQTPPSLRVRRPRRSFVA